MSSNWRPRSQLVAGIRRGEWFLFDGGLRLAIVRALELGPKRTLMFRVVTFHPDPDRRRLIGYFPNLDMAAEIAWAELHRRPGQPPAGLPTR